MTNVIVFFCVVYQLKENTKSVSSAESSRDILEQPDGITFHANC